MDINLEELKNFMTENYQSTDQFKTFLETYTDKQTDIDSRVFSPIINDYIENNTISKSAFLLIPTERDSYTAMNDDEIFGESFTVPKNVTKLYFSIKAKIDGLCGQGKIKIYQLDAKLSTIQDDLTSYDKWQNHVIDITYITIPDNLLEETAFNEYKTEIEILENTVEILPSFVISNNYDKYSQYKNPILYPFNNFFWKTNYTTIDGLTGYYTYRSTHIKRKLQYFESNTIPEITNDYTKLWLCTSDIEGYTKNKLYTPDNTWVETEYTKEQVENGVEITMFDNWVFVDMAQAELDATPRPDVKLVIADCMISSTNASWQPASGENYWGKNIKISGDKGIYIYNTVDGYNRIIDEKQDIAMDNNGNITWELTGKGMKTKRAECESIRLPHLEILCTTDSTAFYYKETGDEDYGT